MLGQLELEQGRPSIRTLTRGRRRRRLLMLVIVERRTIYLASAPLPVLCVYSPGWCSTVVIRCCAKRVAVASAGLATALSGVSDIFGGEYEFLS